MLPDGCVLEESYVRCERRVFEQLLDSYGRCVAELESAKSALTTLTGLVRSVLARVVAEESEVGRLLELLEKARLEDLDTVAKLVEDALARADAIRSSIAVKLCYAIVPHESVPGIKKLPESVAKGLASAVKTARLEFTEAVASLPGVKLVDKGLVYIFFDEGTARRFQALFDELVKPVVERVRRAAEENGVEYQGIAEAGCSDVIMSSAHLKRIVEREVAALRERARELSERLERLRSEKRYKAVYRVKKELEIVHRKLSELERILSTIAGIAEGAAGRRA